MQDVTELFDKLSLRIKKNRLMLLIGLLFGACYLFTRLYHLTELPIFTDEAIYIRWSQIARWDANWRFISLTDGKQPSYVWVAMILLRIFHDPLFAGRLVSVLAGFGTLIGFFFLGREIFKNARVGIIASALYVIYPMALVYDRMALYDSLVGMFSIWSLYFTVLLVRFIRLDIALLLGMTIGGAVLTKSNGFFTMYLLPISLLLFDWRKHMRIPRLFVWVFFAGVAVVLGNLFYSILRLSPFFHIIEEKNALFVFPYNEWLEHPSRFLFGNLFGEVDWLVNYMTLPFVLLIPAAFLLDKKFLREKILLFLWFFFPFFALALFGKVLYPRFIFFMTLSLLPLIAYSAVKIYTIWKNKIIFALAAIAFCSVALLSDYLIITDFGRSLIPSSDKNQFYNDWPAGGGVNEAIAFFAEQAKTRRIFVGTQGTFGLMPTALEIYLGENKNIQLQGYWPIENEPPKELLEKEKLMPTYVLFYQPCTNCPKIGEAPITWPVKEVAQYKKGYGNSSLRIYQVMQ